MPRFEVTRNVIFMSLAQGRGVQGREGPRQGEVQDRAVLGRVLGLVLGRVLARVLGRVLGLVLRIRGGLRAGRRSIFGRVLGLVLASRLRIHSSARKNIGPPAHPFLGMKIMCRPSFGRSPIALMWLFPAEGKGAFWLAFKNHFADFAGDGIPP